MTIRAKTILITIIFLIVGVLVAGGVYHRKAIGEWFKDNFPTKQTVNELKKENEEKDKQLADKDKEISSLNSQLETMQTNLTSLNASLDETTAKLNQKESELNAATTQRATLLSSITEIDNKINSTTDQTEIENLQQKKTAILNQIDSLNTEISTLTQEKETLTAEKAQLQNQITTLQSEKAELERQVEALENSGAELFATKYSFIVHYESPLHDGSVWGMHAGVFDSFDEFVNNNSLVSGYNYFKSTLVLSGGINLILISDLKQIDYVTFQYNGVSKITDFIFSNGYYSVTYNIDEVEVSDLSSLVDDEMYCVYASDLDTGNLTATLNFRSFSKYLSVLSNEEAGYKIDFVNKTFTYSGANYDFTGVHSFTLDESCTSFVFDDNLGFQISFEDGIKLYVLYNNCWLSPVQLSIVDETVTPTEPEEPTESTNEILNLNLNTMSSYETNTKDEWEVAGCCYDDLHFSSGVNLAEVLNVNMTIETSEGTFSKASCLTDTRSLTEFSFEVTEDTPWHFAFEENFVLDDHGCSLKILVVDGAKLDFSTGKMIDYNGLYVLCAIARTGSCDYAPRTLIITK